jgi:uncharacterized membrane protein
VPPLGRLNPNSAARSRRLPQLVLLLSALGAAVAAYLTYAHYDANALVCAAGKCGTVQSSSYATIGPIPIAILGLGMYLTLGALALTRWTRRGPLSTEFATIASWGIAFAATLYAAYLTYVELFVIHAVCQWCVASAIIGLLILVADSAAVWRLSMSETALLARSATDNL